MTTHLVKLAMGILWGIMSGYLSAASSQSALQSCSSSQSGSASAGTTIPLGYKELFNLTVPQLYKACDNRTGAASYAVGLKFYKGLGVSRNLPAAFNEFLKSAKLGNYDALGVLTNMLKAGQAPVKVFVENVSWLKTCSNQNNFCARSILGMLCLFSTTPQQVREEILSYLAQKPLSLEFLKECSKRGDKYAQFSLKQRRQEPQNMTLLPPGVLNVKMLKQLSKGSADAAFDLAALLYHGGSDVAQDLPQAFYYAQRAADMGSAPALFMVSKMYSKGEGVKLDLKKSFEAMKKSAELGYAAACYEFGAMLANGDITKRNFAEGYSWVIKAAKQNHGDALAMLGVLAQFGVDAHNRLVAPDFQKAFKWYQQAAAKKNFQGMYYLAQFYRFGLAGERNDVAAQKLFDQILQDDHGDSLLFKGCMYEGGSGVPKNLKKAKKCYEVCAKNRASGQARICLERVSKRLKEQHEERAKQEQQNELARKQAAQKKGTGTVPLQKEEVILREQATQEDIAGEALKKVLQESLTYDDQSFVSDISVESSENELKAAEQEAKEAKEAAAVTSQMRENIKIVIGNPIDHSIITLDVPRRLITSRELSKLQKFTYDENGVQKWFGNFESLRKLDYSQEDIERHRFSERVDEIVQLYGRKAWFLKHDGTVIKNSVMPGTMKMGDGRILQGTFEYAYYKLSGRNILYHRFFHPRSRVVVRT